MSLKDFKKEYKDKGPYHSSAVGFRAWFLQDNYQALAGRCGPNGRVLDLGCGEGCLADYLPQAQLTGIDYSPDALEFCRQLHPDGYRDLRVGDLTRLEDQGWAPASFDHAVCSLTLMYLKDADLGHCLSTVHALLVPGGNFVLSYPTVSQMRTPNPEAYELTPDSLVAALERAGFVVGTMVPICPLLPRDVVVASTDEGTAAASRRSYEAARAAMTLETSYHFLIDCSKPL